MYKNLVVDVIENVNWSVFYCEKKIRPSPTFSGGDACIRKCRQNSYNFQYTEEKNIKSWVIFIIVYCSWSEEKCDFLHSGLWK